MTSGYILGAYWPARQESIEECCTRLDRVLSALAECDPVLTSWFERGNSQRESLGQHVIIGNRQYLLDLLDRGRNRRDIGRDVVHELGFRVDMWNGFTDVRQVGLSVKCGLYWISPNQNASLSNSVLLDLPKGLGEFSKADKMAAVLAVVAESWEPAWAGVMSRAAMNRRNFASKGPFVDWMTYVPSPIAKVPAPSSVIEVVGLGSIVQVQSNPPSVDEPEELARIQEVDRILKKTFTGFRK